MSPRHDRSGKGVGKQEAHRAREAPQGNNTEEVSVCQWYFLLSDWRPPAQAKLRMGPLHMSQSVRM